MGAESLLIVGIPLLIIGIIIRYLIGKRRFKRRTIGGTQVFKNYNHSLIIPILELLLMLFSVLFILIGMLLLGVWLFNKK